MSVDPRYPIGRFAYDRKNDPQARQERITDIAALPKLMRAAVEALPEDRLDTPYREGGWTVRQVVHHVAESHMHAYLRLKFALLQDTPTILPYDEARWAATSDVATTPVSASLHILDGLHERFVAVLRSLDERDFSRGYFHPEHQRVVTIDELLALYAWHGKHHTAHVRSVAV